MLNAFKRLTDYQEADEIVEESCIPGLFWKRNDFYKTTALSRIILPSPGQSLFTVVLRTSAKAAMAATSTMAATLGRTTC